MINGKPLSDVLGEIENGDFLNEATKELYAIVAAVMQTRRAGTLTISLSIKPTGKGTVNVDALINAKPPKDDRPTTTFFVARDGALQRSDPNQANLPLHVVPDDGAKEPLRVAE